jgi:hypothetical protein|tara:strand:- start:12125 stop:12460 length:336 start_codon:yes stop_codon:yes gene_type:complete
MPINKRDRSFQNIVREIDIENIPVEYVESLTLILKNGDSIVFEGEDLEEIDEDNVISFIMSAASDLANEYDSEVENLEIVMNYSRLEQEIISKTKALLNKGLKDDNGNTSM